MEDRARSSSSGGSDLNSHSLTHSLTASLNDECVSAEAQVAEATLTALLVAVAVAVVIVSQYCVSEGVTLGYTLAALVSWVGAVGCYVWQLRVSERVSGGVSKRQGVSGGQGVSERVSEGVSGGVSWLQWSGNAVMCLRAVMGGWRVYVCMRASEGDPGEVASGAVVACLVSALVSEAFPTHSLWSSLVVLGSHYVCFFLGAVSSPVETFVQVIVVCVLLTSVHVLWWRSRRTARVVSEAVAREVQRLEEKNHEVHALMGNVAHDLKTPLQAFVSELSSISDSDAATRDSLRAMADFMSMMIHRCIDFTKAQSGVTLKPSLETVHITRCIDWVTNTIEHSGKTDGVSIDVEYDLECVSGDVSRWVITDKHWLLENLLCYTSNAVKFVTEGNIVIRVSTMEDAEEDSDKYFKTSNVNPLSTHTHMCHSNINSNSSSNINKVAVAKYIRFSVTDTGIGIPEDKMDRLFKPFFQAQKGAGGTGLGLYALSKRIDALKGRYGVHSRDDGVQGCCFWFSIPYRPDTEMTDDMAIATIATHPSLSRPASISSVGKCLEPSSAADQQVELSKSRSGLSMGESMAVDESTVDQSTVDQSTGQTLHVLDQKWTPRVLLVDDSKMIQKASTRALQREGFRVSNAYNGVECLKLLRDAKETGDGFSVVLLDMHMPVLDGLETVRRIRLEEEKEKGRAAKCGCEGVTYTVTSHTGISIGEDSVRVFPTSREVCCSDNRQYVIGLSANSDQESIDNAATAGMDNFICKPLKVSELREFCAAQIDL